MALCICTSTPSELAKPNSLHRQKIEASIVAGSMFFTGKKSISTNTGDNGELYNRLIDDVTTFNMPLTKNDIKAIMERGIGMTTNKLDVSPSGKAATICKLLY